MKFLQMTDKDFYSWLVNVISEITRIENKEQVIIYKQSIRRLQECIFIIIRLSAIDFLVIVSEKDMTNEFSGSSAEFDGFKILICPENEPNAEMLKKKFPIINPSVLGKQRSSFGTGDRLGIAGPGHIRVFAKYDNVFPVLAQQSMRELELTGRTYRNVINCAVWSVFKTGFNGLWAADGDHLKFIPDVIDALKQGCTMITADLSDKINFDVEQMAEDELNDQFNSLEKSFRERVISEYTQQIVLANGLVLGYNRQSLLRIVLTYKDAIAYAAEIYEAAKTVADDFDYEISIDEISIPTSPEAHYYVTTELLNAGVNFTSLAPRFVGEFQKGIDYIGDITAFEESFVAHAMIAEEFGYKLSIHSASDKFSVYPSIGKNLKGAYHIKTSGTNWLIALGIIASVDPVFFRDLFKFSCGIFNIAKAYYHVTPDMDRITDIEKLNDDELLNVFDNNTDRQILHISYGEIFKKVEYKERFFTALNENIEEYWKRLDVHISNHIEKLNCVNTI